MQCGAGGGCQTAPCPRPALGLCRRHCSRASILGCRVQPPGSALRLEPGHRATGHRSRCGAAALARMDRAGWSWAGPPSSSMLTTLCGRVRAAAPAVPTLSCSPLLFLHHPPCSRAQLPAAARSWKSQIPFSHRIHRGLFPRSVPGTHLPLSCPVQGLWAQPRHRAGCCWGRCEVPFPGSVCGALLGAAPTRCTMNSSQMCQQCPGMPGHGMRMVSASSAWLGEKRQHTQPGFTSVMFLILFMSKVTKTKPSAPDPSPCFRQRAAKRASSLPGAECRQGASRALWHCGQAALRPLPGEGTLHSSGECI